MADLRSVVQEKVKYEPDTGCFTWRQSNGKRAVEGQPAGHINGSGYLEIGLNGASYKAHRLAWLIVHGEFPNGVVDHINRVKTDNRIVNLRLATKAENCRNRLVNSNNTSGCKGVSWHASSKAWQARICIDRKYIYLGVYKDINDAVRAYEDAAIQHHGAFMSPAISE